MNSNNINTYKLIEYLDDELSSDERSLVEVQLNQQTDLQQELAYLSLTKSAVKMYGLKYKVGFIHKEMMLEIEGNKSATAVGLVRRISKISMKIAASLLIGLLCLGVYQYATITNDKMFANEYKTYEVNVSRGVEEIAVLEKLFQEKNYESVIKNFIGIENPAVKENFFVGVSYLETKNYKNAIGAFRKVLELNIAQQQNIFNDDAQYFLALAYLKNKDIKIAYPIFKEIKNNPKHLYNDKITNVFMLNLRLLYMKY